MGADGTIGSVLAKELKNYTNQIRLVSRNPKKVNKTDELFPVDLSDASQFDKRFIFKTTTYQEGVKLTIEQTKK